MSVEVPIIILLLAIPIYFFFGWILKKYKIGNKKNQAFIAIIPTIIFSPLIYIAIIFFWIFSISYYPNKDFNQSIWKSNIEARYEMSKDIIDSNLLIGKTNKEVVDLLGSDFYTHDDNHISYDLGFVPGLFNIDPDFLDIYFENAKVARVEQHGG
ncbi:hypothetical protein [uncultured Maribacter sp.]|uniref:hypothetical protein n=1 Tax=uncultured Maribacter sp. TaxID=431308 RepID=UPI002629436E|nr:hypothetical protein [uncultured Maribacter sp.]